jgi:hypothetical protein
MATRPARNIAAVSSDVAIGLRMKGVEMLIVNGVLERG